MLTLNKFCQGLVLHKTMMNLLCIELDINVYPEITSIVQDHEEFSMHRPTDIDGGSIPGPSNINQARNASANQSVQSCFGYVDYFE